jgi:hypothetical protein
VNQPLTGEIVERAEEFKPLIPHFPDDRMRDYLAYEAAGLRHELILLKCRIKPAEYDAWRDDPEGAYFRWMASRPHQMKRDFLKELMQARRAQVTLDLLELDERSVKKVMDGDELTKDEHELLKTRAKEFLPSVVNRDDTDAPTTQNNTIVVVL